MKLIYGGLQLKGADIGSTLNVDDNLELQMAFAARSSHRTPSWLACSCALVTKRIAIA